MYFLYNLTLFLLFYYITLINCQANYIINQESIINNEDNNNNNIGGLTTTINTPLMYRSKLYDTHIKPVDYINTKQQIDISNFDINSESIVKNYNISNDDVMSKPLREGKEYSYTSGGTDGVSSGTSVSSSSTSVGSSNTNYKYPYPYPGSDTSSGGYYYHYDDKNYWHTAPPAIASEKPPAGTQVLECTPSMPSFFGELFRVGSIAKMGLIRAALIGVLVLLIIKIPILLILKAIIFKVALVPLGAISAMLPILLPLMYFFPNLAASFGLSTTNTTTTTTTAAPAPAAAPAGAPAAQGRQRSLSDHHDEEFFESRAMPFINTNNLQDIFLNLINSDRCIEKIACKLGERDRKMPYRKNISWLLKAMQRSVTEDIGRRLRLYRDAYNFGASKDEICDKGHYPCEIPKITLIQNSHAYRII